MIAQPAGLLELPRQLLAALEHHEIHYQVDLGLEHWLSFTQWAPDMSLEGNRSRWGGIAHLIEAHPVCGAIVVHRCRTESGYHQGSINFKTPATAHWDPAHAAHCWEVESWSPLTISPSLLSHCPCGDHGFIKAGRWVRA